MDKVASCYRKLKSWIDVLGNTAALISAAGLVVMVVVSLIYILQRQVVLWLFPDWTIWLFVDEYCAYLLVLLVYLSLTYTQRKGLHVTVELLTRRYPARVWRYVNLSSLVVVFGMDLYLIMHAVNWMRSSIRENVVSQATGTPMWIGYTPIVVGLCIFALALAIAIVDSVIELRTQKGDK